MTQQPLERELFIPIDPTVSVSPNLEGRTLSFLSAGHDLQEIGMEMPDSPTLTEFYVAGNQPSGAEFSSTIISIRPGVAIVTHRPRFVETGIDVKRYGDFPVGINSVSINLPASTLEPYGMYKISDWLLDPLMLRTDREKLITQSRRTLLSVILGGRIFGPDGNLLRDYRDYGNNLIYCLAGELSELVVVRGENRQPLSIYLYPINSLPPSTRFRRAIYKSAIQEPPREGASAVALGVSTESEQPQITHETVSVTLPATRDERIVEIAAPEGAVVSQDRVVYEQTTAIARRDRAGTLPSVVTPFRAIKSYILPEDMVLDPSVLKEPPIIGWFTGGLAIGGACIAGSITAVLRMDISPYLAPVYAAGTVLLSLSGGLLGLKAGDRIESGKERAGRAESRAIILRGLGEYLQYPQYQPLGDTAFIRLLERRELTESLSDADMELKYTGAFNTRFEQIKSERFVSQKRKEQRATAYAIAAVEMAAGVINIPERIDGEEFYWNSVGRFWNDTHDIGLAVEYAEGLRTHGVFGENLKGYKPHMSFLRYMGYRGNQLIQKPNWIYTSLYLFLMPPIAIRITAQMVLLR